MNTKLTLILIFILIVILQSKSQSINPKTKVVNKFITFNHGHAWYFERQYKIPMEVSLSILAVSSNWGRNKKLTRKFKNPFAIKVLNKYMRFTRKESSWFLWKSIIYDCLTEYKTLNKKPNLLDWIGIYYIKRLSNRKKAIKAYLIAINLRKLNLRRKSLLKPLLTFK